MTFIVFFTYKLLHMYFFPLDYYHGNTTFSGILHHKNGTATDGIILITLYTTYPVPSAPTTVAPSLTRFLFTFLSFSLTAQ